MPISRNPYGFKKNNGPFTMHAVYYKRVHFFLSASSMYFLDNGTAIAVSGAYYVPNRKKWIEDVHYIKDMDLMSAMIDFSINRICTTLDEKVKLLSFKLKIYKTDPITYLNQCSKIERPIVLSLIA